jgi:hypothetical protein
MKPYVCTLCGKIVYSPVSIEHMIDPFCPYCHGEIVPVEEIIEKEKSK